MARARIMERNEYEATRHLETLLKDRSDLIRLRREEPLSIWDLRARIRRGLEKTRPLVQAMQDLGEIEVIAPEEFASAKAVFPKPKF